MLNLSQQIAPSLAARQPDPDQTFGAYVRELLASSKGFGGPFAGGQNQQQTQPTPQTKIVDGLFGKFLPESGSSGGDTVSQGTPVSSQIGVGNMTNAINQQAVQGMFQLGLGIAGVPGMTKAGLTDVYNASQAPNEYMDAVNLAFDPLGAWAASQGHVTPGAYDPWGTPNEYDAYDFQSSPVDVNYDAYDFQGSTDVGGGGDPTSNDGPSNDNGHQSSGD